MTTSASQLDEFMRELTRNQSRLRGLIRCLLISAKDVEDIWQNTNVVLLRKSSKFVPGTDFWAWSSEVARFEVLTYCKKLKRERLVFDEELISLLASEVQQRREKIDDRRDALQKCVQLLPSPQRQLLEMRYESNVTLDEMAERLNRPVGSIRQTLFRIREALLACCKRRLEMTA